MSATGTVIALAKVAPKIGEYLGLIEGVSSNIKKLIHEPFLTAMSNLIDAKRYIEKTQDINEKTVYHYISEAMDNFRKATYLEENENLVSAYAGLSICQYFLGDRINANWTTSQIEDIMLSTSARNQAIAKDLLLSEGRVIHESPLYCEPGILLGRAIVRGGRRALGEQGPYESKRYFDLSEYKSHTTELLKQILI